MSYGYGYGYRIGTSQRGPTGGGEPTITSSDGDPASLTDNGDGTYGVVIDGSTVGTITQEQINAGGFITVVSPITGMSGNNIVLTTTGYVIHVGSTPIETDVEVLADGVVVGTALPFDATAYPDAELVVRFAYSVGGTPLVISATARLAQLKLIQFRDSFLNSGAAWPSGQYTRQATVVMRLEGVFNNSPSFSVFMTGLINLRFGSSNTLVSGTSAAASFTGNLNVFAHSTSIRQLSLMAALDLDAGLPGGETFVLWASINGGTWARVGGFTATTTGNLNASGASLGSVNSGVVGPNFDLHNHLWMANQALNPATNWPNFFNADGTVKRLGSTGVIAGVTPVIYLFGNDFLTGNNRGTGTTPVARGRTALAVVNA